jgi:hypothetical protein
VSQSDTRFDVRPQNLYTSFRKILNKSAALFSPSFNDKKCNTYINRSMITQTKDHASATGNLIKKSMKIESHIPYD